MLTIPIPWWFCGNLGNLTSFLLSFSPSPGGSRFSATPLSDFYFCGGGKFNPSSTSSLHLSISSSLYPFVISTCSIHLHCYLPMFLPIIVAVQAKFAEKIDAARTYQPSRSLDSSAAVEKSKSYDTCFPLVELSVSSGTGSCVKGLQSVSSLG